MNMTNFSVLLFHHLGSAVKLISLWQYALLITVIATLISPETFAISVTTRSYDNARTGWNSNETTLTPGNVNSSTFHKIAEIRVDDKIEASPLLVQGVNTLSGIRDLLIVSTTNNTIYAFDANTHEQVWAEYLGEPVKHLKDAIYDRWGITSTPVIDPDTNTLYVVRLGVENKFKVYRLYGLKLFDGSKAITTQPVDGFTVKIDDNTFFRNGEQYIRTGLALWKNDSGDKAIIFGAAGGENQFGANGWVIAFNIAKLNAGGNVQPAVWCSTPNGGGGGIWMASQGVAIDESDPNRDIYVSTGNGSYNDPFFSDPDLSESVVRLRYNPVANTLNAIDRFTPFTDDSRDENHKDQDLSAGGVILIPGTASVLAGGKDGLIFNVNRDDMGHLSHDSLLQPGFVGSFTPTPGFDYLANINQSTTTDGVVNTSGGNRTFIPHPADGGRTRHIHGSPAYFENNGQKMVYVMGENSTLRAYLYNNNVLIDPPVAQSAPSTKTSGNTAAPGGMAGAFLTISSANLSGDNGIVWAVAPLKSMWRDPVAAVVPVPGVLRAFRAEPSNSEMVELWNSEMDTDDWLGSLSKWQPPFVVNGKVYLATYDNRVVVYGNTQPRQKPRDIRRTMILIKAVTQPGQDMFIRGGIDHDYGNSHRRDCPTTSNPAKDDPRYYHCAIRIEHRNTINYGLNHEVYPITNRWQVNDRYLDWYGTEEFQTYQRRDQFGHDLGLAQGSPLDWTTNSNGPSVIRQGYGFLKENADAGLGDHYWMLDVDMDCATAEQINGTHWFEVKSFITNTANGFESDVNQADRPYASGNHFAQCGRINIFERNSSKVTYRDFDSVNECSFPDQEKRCDSSVAQICRSVDGNNIWQDDRNCVDSQELCQTSTGMCCIPSNGDNSNRNCL